MKNIISIPGYAENDYLLVLQPHIELSNEINKIKIDFAEKYNAPSAKYGKSQLTLVKYRQYEMMEERIVHRLHNITSSVSEFKIELENFGSFPTHSIYINVTTKVPVQSLVKQIKTMQQLLKHKDTKPHFIEEIGFTIARKLLPWQYEKAWLEYSHSVFNGRFIADHMLLLKKPLGEMKYLPVERFHFLNLQIKANQSSLFS